MLLREGFKRLMRRGIGPRFSLKYFEGERESDERFSMRAAKRIARRASNGTA